MLNWPCWCTPEPQAECPQLLQPLRGQAPDTAHNLGTTARLHEHTSSISRTFNPLLNYSNHQTYSKMMLPEVVIIAWKAHWLQVEANRLAQALSC